VANFLIQFKLVLLDFFKIFILIEEHYFQGDVGIPQLFSSNNQTHIFKHKDLIIRYNFSFLLTSFFSLKSFYD
jgi:hypothetical protein